jgi:hypothetical protein
MMDTLGAAGTTAQSSQPDTAAGSGMAAAGVGVTGSAATGAAGIPGAMNAGSSASVTGGAGGAAASASSAGAPAAAGAGGAAGGSAVAGSGGSGVPVAQPDPFKPTGEALTGSDKQWKWYAFPDSKCRDSSMAGIGISLNSASKKVMLYLEGGGACFDSGTCASSPANISSQSPTATGLFDRAQSANPVRDWNYVYVPYCTGDVHIGDASDVMIDGVTGKNQFVGRRNLEAFLNRIVPTFASADQVLLTGVSAGGFGASSNAEFVQWAFGTIPVTMIDDSGPAMSNKFIPICMSDLERTKWGLDNTILKLCGSDCPAGGDFSVDYAKHVAKLAASMSGAAGLIESNQDQVIRWFYGVGTDNGKNDCKGALVTTPMDAMLFEQGLLEYRMLMKDIYPTFSTYYPASTQHTWLGGASLYTQTTANVKMIDWVTSIIMGKPPGHVGP